MSITIAALNTYPVKGLCAKQHVRISATAHEVLPFDRAWAIEAGGRKFDPVKPGFLPKIAFAQLMSNERLAQLETTFEESGRSQFLTISRDGKQVAKADISTPIGRGIIEQFMAAFLANDLRGSPRLVHAAGHHFCDAPSRLISVLNLASVREIERVAGKPLDPYRFRANIHIDGAEPWEEFSWLGKRITINGSAVLRVEDRITRCAATNVNPETAERDINLPRLLETAFRHRDCGVYVSCTADTTLETAQAISVE
jgi:uncharacterized protein YcbX